MDAVEYLKILARMHYKQEDCSHCVLPNGCDITKDEKEIKKRVEIIEKWGKENPIVTRQMKFLEMFPRAEVTDGGADFLPEHVRCWLQGRKKLQEYHMRRMPRRILV